jgi:carotenoid cleavage dioxygenase
LIEPKKSVFLMSNFGPVFDELYAEKLPVVRGKIPKNLEGMYIRNGPNPRYTPNNYHWVSKSEVSSLSLNYY